ncbi:MAG: hypothetical protein ABUS57_07895 [Pseudomonadota bacterium]
MEVPILVQIGGSAAVIAFMVAMAALLGFRSATRIDEAALQRIAADADGKLAAAFIAPHGRLALAHLADGRILAARVMGADISTRLAPAKAVRLTLTHRQLSAEFGDIGFPPLHMSLKNTAPPAWVVQLAGQGEKT